MKQLLISNFKLLTKLSRAYQSLRLIFDPATEGNPYRANNKTDNRTYIARSYWSYKPYDRYVIQEA